MLDHLIKTADINISSMNFLLNHIQYQTIGFQNKSHILKNSKRYKVLHNIHDIDLILVMVKPIKIRKYIQM